MPTMLARHWLIAALVALAALASFANSLRGAFLYDDRTYVTENPSVVAGAAIFTEATPPHRKDLGLFRPLTVASYRLTWNAVGLDPFAFHLGNALLHALASALLAIVAVRVGATALQAGAAGLLFAVHPVHVEAVAWVVGRAEILALVLAAAAVLAHGRPTDRWPLARAAAGAALYLAASLAKESALPLPLLLLLLDLSERPRPRPARLALRIAPAAAAALALIAWRLAVLGRFAPDVAADAVLASMGPQDRLALGAAVFGKAAAALLAPVDLSIYYDPRRLQTGSAVALGIAAAVAALALTVRAVRRGDRAIAAGLIAAIVMLAPFLHLVPIQAWFADRFMYLPSAGACIAGAALLLPRGRERSPARLGALALLALAAAAATVARNPAFRTEIGLWQDAAEADPAAAFPLFQLGNFYREAGQLEYQSKAQPGALHYFRESLRVDPESPYGAEAHLFLGEHAAAALGDARAAAGHYRAAIVRKPDLVAALLDLAALEPSGEVSTEEARALLEHALAVTREPAEREAARALLARLP